MKILTKFHIFTGNINCIVGWLSEFNWGRKKARHIISRYEEKLWIPAPLSLLFYILKTFCFFLSKIPIIGVIPNYFMKILHIFEGKVYAKERRKNRKYEAVMNGLISNPNRWDGPTEDEKKSVELVREQMSILVSFLQYFCLYWLTDTRWAMYTLVWDVQF